MSEDISPYHNFSPKYPVEHQMNNWMKNLWSAAKVSTLSIPGSHDSGTYSCGKVRCCQFCFSTQCQIWSIYDQLNLGIRYLDIRAQMKDDQPYIRHGFVCFDRLQVIFTQVADFLNQNSSQFIILDFQGEIPDTTCILNILKKQGINYVLSQTIPTVGELRGKVWLISGFGIRFQGTFQLLGIGGMVDRPNCFMQNHFCIERDITMEKKVQLVIETAFNRNCDPTKMKVNYLSVAGEGNIKGFLLGPHPYQVAAMKKGPNATLLHELQSRPKSHLGLTIMDYPGNQLIKAIISHNDFYSNQAVQKIKVMSKADS